MRASKTRYVQTDRGEVRIRANPRRNGKWVFRSSDGHFLKDNNLRRGLRRIRTDIRQWGDNP